MTQTDVRVPWVAGTGSQAVGFDNETPLFLQEKFVSWDDDVPLASGIEAQLIIAESQYNSGDVAGMLTTLNGLRTTVGLADLVDPGTDTAREDMLFEERARWLFGTAHRLGDLRRMIRQYGRTEDGVFPTGTFFKGGVYGDDVNFPIHNDETFNPNFESCLDRGA
jgi:hypothetical protein